MLLASLQFDWRLDGWIHLIQDGQDLPRGPLGVFAYLPFALSYPLIPTKWRLNYLWLTSLLVAALTLGLGYAATLAGLSLIAYGLVVVFGQRGRAMIGVSVLSVLYTALIVFPQPPWLPPVREPLYFYLHWAGLGYLFLRSVHVLIDVGAGKFERPAATEFWAYLLFAPTLRVGPIYRYPEFREQVAGVALDRGTAGTEPGRYGMAAIRIVTGAVRLGIMGALIKRWPPPVLFERPEAYTPAQLALAIYLTPLMIYLWISGLIDLNVGIGRIMGFVVPENFNYPWRALSLGEFWRRWHMTLGSWLRDYVYIPLGGNRRHVWFNYTVTFVFCGLWHGTYLSYILWGFSQGVGLTVNRSWGLYWASQRDRGTLLYQRLASLRLVQSPLNAALCWLLTFHYQILTIAWFMDERFAGRRLAGHIRALLGG